LIFVAARRQQDLAASAGQEHKELAENGSEDGQTGIAARAWRRGMRTRRWRYLRPFFGIRELRQLSAAIAICAAAAIGPMNVRYVG